MQSSRPLAIFGDWHGDLNWALTAVRSAAREGARSALHVGDFGLDWPGAKRGRYESKLNKYLEDLGVVLTVSGGNHDCWPTLVALPVGADGTATFRSNIKVLPRGGRTAMEDLTVGGFGGAFSVDFEHRTEGKDWWPDEEPTLGEAEKLVASGPLDILISHDAPAGVPLTGDFQLRPELAERADRTRLLLRQVVDSLAVPYVFCGHWHQRRIHELVHPDGRITRVDVLNMEKSPSGNGVLVWTGDSPLLIETLHIGGSQT
ncbi:metallophosphoesterase family protein [Arthrobacter wenxiniae]|uniref:Metallophosphoesterase n=1 Tax=Arthrobacter wenxiniae TaxID=2713570 RepID=A0A7Y7IIV0_9MICC|nr:metallophosphoesterase [Arthrobacter wenxiniae]NVM96118.1 metallophosphoesterase [Arthrobacter wenxiniae]